MNNNFAVVGNPINHSLSPLIHQLFAQQFNMDIQYKKLFATSENFSQLVWNFLKAKGKGLNITAPFKQAAFALAQHPSIRCLKAAAANTLWMEDNLLFAENTDGIGLLLDLQKHITINHGAVLILGAGGAVRGILQSLIDHEMRVVICNRTPAKIIELQQIFPEIQVFTDKFLTDKFDLIINATSENSFPLAIPINKILESQPFCYDLRYSVDQNTDFVDWVSTYQCLAIDGLGMLIEQAAESFFIWHKKRPNTENIKSKLQGIKN